MFARQYQEISRGIKTHNAQMYILCIKSYVSILLLNAEIYQLNNVAADDRSEQSIVNYAFAKQSFEPSAIALVILIKILKLESWLLCLFFMFVR